jgi:hypothetical protein
MAGINEKQYLEEEVSLRELILKIQYFIKYLLSKWYLILSAVILGAAAGYFYNFKKPISYTSYCTFVVEGGQPAPVSGLAALLSGGASNSSGGGLFQGGTLLSLYTTRLMLEKTLFSKVQRKKKPILLIDWYLQINKEGNSWSEVPENARGAKLAAIVSKIAADYVTVESGSFVTVKVESPDELFSFVFSEKLIQTVNDFYITTKTKKSLQNLNILTRQADSLRTILTISMGGAAIAADAYPNANPAMKVLAVESQKRNIDVQATTSLYSGVVTNLETTKMELRRETPLIQIIDRPMLPLSKTVPDVNKGVIFGGIASGFIICVLILIHLFYRKLMFNEQI